MHSVALQVASAQAFAGQSVAASHGMLPSVHSMPAGSSVYVVVELLGEQMAHGSLGFAAPAGMHVSLITQKPDSIMKLQMSVSQVSVVHGSVSSHSLVSAQEPPEVHPGED